MGLRLNLADKGIDKVQVKWMISKNALKPKIRIMKKQEQSLAEFTLKKYQLLRFDYLGYTDLIFRDKEKSSVVTSEKNYYNQLISNIQMQLSLLNNKEPSVSISKETIIIYLERLLKNTIFIAINYDKFLYDSYRKINLNEVSSHQLMHQLQKYPVDVDPLLSTVFKNNIDLIVPNAPRGRVLHKQIAGKPGSYYIKNSDRKLLDIVPEKKDKLVSFNRTSKYFDIYDNTSGDTYRMYNRNNKLHHGDYYQNEIRFLQEQALMQTSSMPFKEAIFKQVLLLLRHTSLIAPGMSENKSKIEIEILQLIKFFSSQNNRLKVSHGDEATVNYAQNNVNSIHNRKFSNQTFKTLNDYIVQPYTNSNYTVIKNLIEYVHDNNNISSQVYHILKYLLITANNGPQKSVFGNISNHTMQGFLFQQKISGLQKYFYSTNYSSSKFYENRIKNNFTWSTNMLGRALNNALSTYSINKLDTIYNSIVSIMQHWMSSEAGSDRYLNKTEFYKDFVNYLESNIYNESSVYDDAFVEAPEFKAYELDRIIDKLPYRSFINKPLTVFNNLSYNKFQEHSILRSPEFRDKIRAYFTGGKQELISRNKFKYMSLSDKSYSDFINNYLNLIAEENIFYGEAGVGWIETLKSVMSKKLLKTGQEINLHVLDYIVKNNSIKKNIQRMTRWNEATFRKLDSNSHQENYLFTVSKMNQKQAGFGVKLNKKIALWEMNKQSVKQIAGKEKKDFEESQINRKIRKHKINDTEISVVTMDFKKEKASRGQETAISKTETTRETVHTVVHVEKPVSTPGQQQNNLDMDKLVDKVYGEIEKRIRNERQLLGL